MLNALECVLDMMYADLGPDGEDADHVEAQGAEVWFSDVEVMFGYGIRHEGSRSSRNRSWTTPFSYPA